ncbi:MAG: alpha-D-glucose phosphate-specific phosphoglucomutase [Gammaproteobacteria bacterium]|nr:alpha-D-glucose phosphate-specific phosphoglucomutase [Gammaproteobacteria bacterium]
MSTLEIILVNCPPFADQRPGTAGLRKKVSVFKAPHYLEMFSQAVFTTLRLPDGARLVIGGDGRYFNSEAIQRLIAVAVANGVREIIVGQNGLLSTPAASHLIRQRQAAAGFILTASHNPGGPDGDFGLKFNTPTGGQAPEHVTDEVFRVSQQQTDYRRVDLPPLSLDRIGVTEFSGLRLEVVDPVADYSRLMESLFDFDHVAAWLRGGHRLRFDAMHAVTGPYARRILVDRLGASPDSILHEVPLPDFGGLHPDPNPIDAAGLVEESMEPNAPDLLAASDGDGDRNMILGPRTFVSPCDSVAVMLANITRIPGYRNGVPGVARSMPTSRALDVVAASLDVPCYETPTGWRFFCNLLDAGRIGLCGEESFGTSSAHCREKDGLWAVLFWLNLLAVDGRPLPDILKGHWQQFGRHHYQRWDYVVDDAGRAAGLMTALRALLPALRGTNPAGGIIETADDFHYRDPVDGSESPRQGVRLIFSNGARIVYRLSGTGTAGATLRVYLEQHATAPAEIARPTSAAVAPLGQLAAQIARIHHHTGLTAPSGMI